MYTSKHKSLHWMWYIVSLSRSVCQSFVDNDILGVWLQLPVCAIDVCCCMFAKTDSIMFKTNLNHMCVCPLFKPEFFMHPCGCTCYRLHVLPIPILEHQVVWYKKTRSWGTHSQPALDDWFVGGVWKEWIIPLIRPPNLGKVVQSLLWTHWWKLKIWYGLISLSISRRFEYVHINILTVQPNITFISRPKANHLWFLAQLLSSNVHVLFTIAYNRW